MVLNRLRAAFIAKNASAELITPSVSKFKVDKRTLKIDIDVQNTEAPRYWCYHISGLEVKDSPTWLQNRLKSSG
jgi:phenylalanyl-tRNA synthetase beta chain